MSLASGLIRNLKPSQFGQPVFGSHSHLLSAKELTPGINQLEYHLRRKQLVDSLPDNSIVVAVAAPIKYQSSNIFYKYRQNSDFAYLSGFHEPASALVLEKAPSTSRGYIFTLFHSPHDASQRLWDGARTSHAHAKDMFGLDASYPAINLASFLKSALPKYDTVFVDLPPSYGKRRRSSILQALQSVHTSREADAINSTEVFDAIGLGSKMRRALGKELAKFRAVKSPAEQALMHVAGDISGRAHAKTMRFAGPGMSEHVVQAHFEYLCAREGSQRPAYVPVVASGPNSLIIHYTNNDQLLQDGEMVLLDAGCEYNGYASDITRTFPVSPTGFTSAQKELYSAVLNVQKMLIAMCTEHSGLSLQGLHWESVRLLKKELEGLGFNLSRHGLIDRLYPHYVGHGIGMDLHESTGEDRTAKLRAGMVVTVEPGVYVPPDPIFPAQYHNLGIRIEDEVLVGETHPVILTASAPKEIVDVEGACAGLLGFEAF